MKSIGKMLAELPAIAVEFDDHNAEEPVFKEPWEATAFALTIQLHQQGHFTWQEELMSNLVFRH